MMEKLGFLSSREGLKTRVSKAAIKAAALACAQVLALGGNTAAHEVSEMTPDAPPIVRTIETSVIMQYPQGSRVDYTADYVEGQLQKADEAITLSSYGTVTFEDETSTYTRSDVPQGDKNPDPDVIEPCYTPEQINGIHEAHRLEYKLGESVFTLLVLNGIKTCGNYGALADWRENISTYNFISAGVIAHEFGHSPLAGNNKHAASLDCVEESEGEEENGKIIPISYSTADIGEKIAAGCGPALKKDGEMNAYSARQSVMGSKRSLNNDQAFLPTELARVAPERFKVTAVSPHSGRHYLSAEPDDTVGVKVYLPDRHPLKTVDPSINTISFGLMLDNPSRGTGIDADMSIYAIAEGSMQSYVLDTELFTQLRRPRMCDPDYDKNNGDFDYYNAPIIYSDKTMDMVVSIGRDNENGDQPYVQLDSYEATKDKRARLKREIDKRRAKIFGDQANTGSPTLLPILR